MIGVLLSPAQFERPPGDIGHPETLPFPALFETAHHEENFLSYARSLKNRGAKAIITEHYTDPELFHELSMPVYTSPLTLLSMLIQTTTGKIALLSDKESTITPKLLQPFHPYPIQQLIIAGMDDMPAFTEAYVTGTRPLDTEAVTFEMKFVTQRMKKTNPDLAVVILTSPYMSAYRSAVREASVVPVFDVVTLATFIHNSLS